jgi:hypothetical protein
MQTHRERALIKNESYCIILQASPPSHEFYHDSFQIAETRPASPSASAAAAAAAASTANASVTKTQVAHRMTLADTMEKGSSARTSTSLRKVAPSAGDDGAVGDDSVRAVGASLTLIEVAPADMPADTEL